MNYVTLGKTGLKAAVVSFGGIPIQRADGANTKAVVDKLEEYGINYIDTARGYTVSEEYLGAALEGRRDKFILATKSMSRDAASMAADVETSLRNLRTGYIDLYQLHNLPEKDIEKVFGPGGAYEDGAFGPEQILCSESNLYPILVAHKRDFYDKNRDYRRGSLFTDRALYVPEVLFSRGGDVRRADVLVIAEPVRAFALENHRSERECDKALADRIEAIFRIAAANGTETLIVGAFGCGRNGYPVEQVIELIQNWIAEHPGAVPNVVFAVPRMHADAFREAFGAPEPERPAPVVVAEGENDREGDDEDWRNVELPEGVTLR